MRTSLHDLWGCGRGPVTRAAPQTRLLAGAATFASCMVSTGATLSGSLCAGLICACWLWACRPPWRVVRTSLLLGLTLFLPYFLLLPLLADAPLANPESWRRALVVPWTIVLRGLCGMLVCTAAVTSVSASDLREALLRLPVPSIVSAILLQIVHQTATLFSETKQVASAMAVRGASSGGLAAWRVLFSLPQVWLPRVIVRAERVADAMELRGYCDLHPVASDGALMGTADFTTLGATLVALGIATTFRVLGAP